MRKMRKNTKRIKQSVGDRIFDTVNIIIIALFFVVCLYPMIFVISASISDPNAVAAGKMLLFPVGLTLEGYQRVFSYKDIWTGYANTIFYTVAGTCLNLLFTIPAAYALSRKDLKGRNFIMAMFIVTMYLDGGLIPTYLNMYNFGLVHTRGALLVSGLVSVFNLIVARTFFSSTIPHELQEAAYIDGCSTFRLFLKIVLPLSSPIIVVMALYYGVAHWNEYFNAFIYLKDRNMFPLQVVLKEILTQSQLSAEAMVQGGFTREQITELQKMGAVADQMKYAIIVVAALPMLSIYPWLQKFFSKGIMIGSIKG